MAGLFRDEALAYHLASRVEGDVLRLPPSWVRWTYPFLALSVAVALAFLWLAPVHEYADGPAVVRGSVTAYFPAGVAGSLHEGQELVLSAPGDRGSRLSLRIREVGRDLEARDPGPVVAVRADLPDPAPDAFREGSVGQARVVVSTEPLLFTLLRARRRPSEP